MEFYSGAEVLTTSALAHPLLTKVKKDGLLSKEMKTLVQSFFLPRLLLVTSILVFYNQGYMEGIKTLGAM